MKIYNWTEEVPNGRVYSTKTLVGFQRVFERQMRQGETELTYSMPKLLQINDRKGLYGIISDNNVLFYDLK